MKLFLCTLVLLGGLNLILARSIYWGPYHTDIVNPWSHYGYDDELFSLPERKNSEEKNNFKKIAKLFDSSEDSKESEPSKTSDEFDEEDVIETVRASQLKEIESFLNTMLGEDISEDGRKIEDKSKESSKEKDNDSDDDDDSNNEKDNSPENDNDDEIHFKEIESFLSTILGEDISEVETKIDDNSQEKSKEKDDDTDDDDDDNNEKYNSPENENDASDNSQEQIPVKDENESKESNETLTLNNNEEKVSLDSQTIKSSDEKLEENGMDISEKDIRELTAILMTLSTLDDLMKIAESIDESDELLNDEELNEKKLKEVNEHLSLFGSLLDQILDDSTEIKEGTKKFDNDDNNSKENESDNSSKAEKDNDDDDDKEDKDDSNDDDDKDEQKISNEDSSVSLEFHGIENTKTNLDNHRYDILARSTPNVAPKPTSSPYIPEILTSNTDNNNIIQEYVEVREKLDNLQDNLLLNKLNMDKDFYNIIANENDDKNMKKFENDIAVLRENAYKIKQSLDDMQDVKSKLYFHKLIKSALKGVKFN